MALTYEVKKLTKDLAASNTAQQVSELAGKGACRGRGGRERAGQPEWLLNLRSSKHVR